MPSAPCPAAGHMNLGRDYFADELRLAQAVQSRRGEDDGVVLAGFELAQAGIHVAAQRMNVRGRDEAPSI